MFRRRPGVQVQCPSCGAAVVARRSRLWASKETFCPECGRDLPEPLKAAYTTYRYTSYARRLLASLIDFHPLAVSGLLVAVGFWVIANREGYEDVGKRDVVALAIFFDLFVTAVLQLAQVWLWRRGLSVGKRAAGLRVVKEDGEPARFLRMLVRELVGKDVFFIAVTVLSGGVGGLAWVLVPLWDRNRQAPHDTLAATVVVRSAEGWSATIAGAVLVMLALEVVLAALLLSSLKV